jgi:hypothetical protein
VPSTTALTGMGRWHLSSGEVTAATGGHQLGLHRAVGDPSRGAWGARHLKECPGRAALCELGRTAVGGGAGRLLGGHVR